MTEVQKARGALSHTAAWDLAYGNILPRRAWKSQAKIVRKVLAHYARVRRRRPSELLRSGIRTPPKSNFKKPNFSTFYLFVVGVLN